MRFQDKTVVVTGAASGIGAATARLFAVIEKTIDQAVQSALQFQRSHGEAVALPRRLAVDRVAGRWRVRPDAAPPEALGFAALRLRAAPAVSRS